MDFNNTQIKFVLSTICEACLSSDRKTAFLEDSESKSLFCDMLNDFEYLNNSLLLCWECRAILRKTVLFRRQVRDAREQLIRCTMQPSKLTSQSHLATSSTTIIDTTTSPITPIVTIKTIKDKPTLSPITNKTTQEPTASPITHKTALEPTASPITNKAIQKYEIEDVVDDHRPNGEVPVTFIKVEDAVYSEEIEDIHGDDYDRQSSIDDTELTPNIAPNSKKARKKNNEEFDDSDDEPLKSKQKVSRVKHRGRREQDGGDNENERRIHRAPRREEPPGVVNNPRVEKKLQQLNVTSGLVEMVVLSWEEVEADRQRALASERFTRHEYRCGDCVLGFNHRTKLEHHMEKHRPCSGEQVCSVCKVRCRDAHALRAHRRRHRVRWRCRACGALWSRAGVAADHAAREHRAAPASHACSLCAHRAPSLSKLRIHIKSHGERQKCELCGKTFRDKSALRTHLFIHKGEKEYACPRCEKRFLFKKAMELHLVTHDAPAHLYCHECDMNFKNKMSYYQHLKYNLKHVDPAKLKYSCASCDKRFVKASRLREHELAVHLRASAVRCAEGDCQFVCSTRPALRTHTHMVHRGGRALRNHVCHVCGKAYTTKNTLSGHLRSHTGERPFRCPLCPSTFGYEAALYNHNKLVHLKVKTGRSRPPAAPAPAAWALHVAPAPSDVT